MRIKHFIFFSLSLMSVCAYAQTDGQMVLGYSGENISKSSEYGIDEAGSLSAAIKVDPSQIGDLTNLKVAGISVGLASRLNVENLNIWIREDLNGDNIAFRTTAPQKGWNNVNFDAVSVPCKPFYIGYTIKTGGPSYPVSVVDGFNNNGFFLNINGEWENLSLDTSKVLSILTFIEAENLPQFDIALTGMQTEERMKIGSHSPIIVTLKNCASRTISGFNLEFEENGLKSIPYNISCSLLPGKEEAYTIDYQVQGDARLPECNLKAYVTGLIDGIDENLGNNALESNFNLCKFDFTKNVLLEEFTTSLCSNCPAAAEKIHQILEMPEYKDRIIVCAHHAGFGTDLFTRKWDTELLPLYGEEGTYCPAAMFDRTAIYSNDIPVTGIPGEISELRALIDKFISKTASVELAVSARYDKEKGKLHVTVNGGRDKPYGDTENRITVYLLENNIYDPRQKGADDDYYQQHVIRDANAIWGEQIEWN
ncbi:MAG: Omp28-related outer membrane protein, partial [Muribaculaceae bacterium]|nr:Omp28-related outer membrane protein [Muribaculaceae bacterium]